MDFECEAEPYLIHYAKRAKIGNSRCFVIGLVYSLENKVINFKKAHFRMETCLVPESEKGINADQ